MTNAEVPDIAIPNQKETLIDINKALRDWFWCFKSWAFVHYALGITSTIGAVLVASSIEIGTGIGTEYKHYVSIYVAVSTAILTFLKAQSKTNAYITAWRILRSERMKYFAGVSSLGKLAETYKSGEELIVKND